MLGGCWCGVSRVAWARGPTPDPHQVAKFCPHDIPISREYHEYLRLHVIKRLKWWRENALHNGFEDNAPTVKRLVTVPSCRGATSHVGVTRFPSTLPWKKLQKRYKFEQTFLRHPPTPAGWCGGPSGGAPPPTRHPLVDLWVYPAREPAARDWARAYPAPGPQPRSAKSRDSAVCVYERS